MTEWRADRRRFLAGATGLLAGVAGCSGTGGSDGETGSGPYEPGDVTGGGRVDAAVGRRPTVGGDGAPAATRTPGASPDGRSPADAIGVAHAAGTYSFTDRNYLNEGAAEASDAGANVLKVWLQSMASKYPFDSEWPDAEEPAELVRTPHVRELFDRPFDTFVLVTASTVGGHNFYFRDGFTDDQYEREVATFRKLTRHLLREYDGTGTEFVLQHWEGDWGILGSDDPSAVATDDQFAAMGRWLTARQAGIRQAREAVDSDVTVLGAAEVNLVTDAMTGTPRVITEVVPETDCDLVSLSAWQPVATLAGEDDPRAIAERFREILAFVTEHAPEPDGYARERLGDAPNVYVGELGWPLNRDGPTRTMRLLRATTEAALAFGARYVLYWQVFDNETVGDVSGRPATDEVPGHHLVAPDGTRSPTWDYLARRTSATAPASGEWVPLVFRFDRTVPEQALNPDVGPSRGRPLTAALDSLVVDGPGGEVTYDIGHPGREPVVGDGVSVPESADGTRYRWLADRDGESTFYRRAGRVTDARRLRVVGSPAADGMAVTVALGGVTSDHTFPSSAWLSGELDVSLSRLPVR